MEELYKLEADSVYWKPWLARADIVVLNVGHHYHVVDKGFYHYERLVKQASRRLELEAEVAAINDELQLDPWLQAQGDWRGPLAAPRGSPAFEVSGVPKPAGIVMSTPLVASSSGLTAVWSMTVHGGAPLTICHLRAQLAEQRHAASPW